MSRRGQDAIGTPACRFPPAPWRELSLVRYETSGLSLFLTPWYFGDCSRRCGCERSIPCAPRTTPVTPVSSARVRLRSAPSSAQWIVTGFKVTSVKGVEAL